MKKTRDFNQITKDLTRDIDFRDDQLTIAEKLHGPGFA